MEHRTKGNNTEQKPTILGYVNQVLEVQNKAGNWIPIKTSNNTSIPLMSNVETHKKLLANPEAITDPTRVRVVANIHVLTEEPDCGEF